MMAFYVVLFSALLVPGVRVYAITMVGQADRLSEIEYRPARRGGPVV